MPFQFAQQLTRICILDVNDLAPFRYAGEDMSGWGEDAFGNLLQKSSHLARLYIKNLQATATRALGAHPKLAIGGD
jgi:hypothetical protein